MHTAVQLTTSRFGITADGAPATFEDVFPGWHLQDRFGIVVGESLGAVGASLLLQLAIAAFYEADPTRPGRVYPEVYVFHVGELRSSYAWYDVFPPRKEVVVPDDPGAILDAINDRAITRLAVPDGPVMTARLHHQEPATALDRIVSAFAYATGGRAADADLEIAALDPQLVDNTTIILDPEHTEELQHYLFNVIPEVKPTEDPVYPTIPDVPLELREAFSARRAEISRDGLPVEAYRRITPFDALGMLRAGVEAGVPA